MNLISSSEKTTAGINCIEFDVQGKTLSCLSGEMCRNITWEPSETIDVWVRDWTIRL